MAFNLGVHIGSMTHSMEDLLKVYRMADEAGLYWISVSDHFYPNPLGNLEQRTIPCFEGAATMAALAATTRQARVGCMMFCAPFRNPGLLAKTAVTIDHISGGRAELGLGAGWFQQEFEDFGYPFPEDRERMDRFEEALQVLRALLHEGSVTFKGRYYEMNDAVCAPRPVQQRLRIWVGGRGPRRTPRIAAQYADGYNVPYLDPQDYHERLETLHRACENAGRDPATLAKSINLHFLMGADEAAAEKGRQRYAALPDTHRQGALLGRPPEAVDRIAEYRRLGIDGLNIAFRPPVDWDSYQAFLEEVAPAFG